MIKEKDFVRQQAGRIDLLAQAMGFKFFNGEYVRTETKLKEVAAVAAPQKRAYQRKAAEKQTRGTRKYYRPFTREIRDAFLAAPIGGTVDLTDFVRDAKIPYLMVKNRIANFCWWERKQHGRSLRCTVKRDGWNVIVTRTS